MAFFYGSGRAIPGFDEPQPFKDSLRHAAYNFQSAIGFLIVAVATLLPWILLIALGLLLFRRLGPRWNWADGGYVVDEPEAVASKPRKGRGPA